jgi:hypothetical protein
MSYKSITKDEVKLRILLNAEEPIQFKRKSKGHEHHQWNDMNIVFRHLLSVNLIEFNYEYRIKLEE